MPIFFEKRKNEGHLWEISRAKDCRYIWEWKYIWDCTYIWEGNVCSRKKCMRMVCFEWKIMRERRCPEVRKEEVCILGSGCVAQLEERSLPISEVCGLNPVIGKKLFILNICLLSTVYWKDEIKKKRPGMAHFFKKMKFVYNEAEINDLFLRRDSSSAKNLVKAVQL